MIFVTWVNTIWVYGKSKQKMGLFLLFFHFCRKSTQKRLKSVKPNKKNRKSKQKKHVNPNNENFLHFFYVNGSDFLKS